MTSVPVSREEEINTVVLILESRALLEKVADAIGPATILDPLHNPLRPAGTDAKATATNSGGIMTAVSSGLERVGLKNPLTPRERAVIELQKHLTIEAAKKSNVVLLSHVGPSPDVSQLIIARLIDFYLDEHVRMNRTPHAHEFLKEQAAALRTQLAGQEDQLRSFKNSSGLASPAEQRQILVQRIGRLEDERKEAEATAASAAAEVKQLAGRLSDLSPTQVLGASAGFPNVAADGMRQQLYTLQLKEKDLASRVTDKHVELRFVREQIADANKVLDGLENSRTQTTTGPNHTYEELHLAQLRQEAALASLRAKSAVLNTQLADARRDIQRLNDNEVHIAQIQRDIQILEGSYRKYADSLEQARIDESLERQRISNINVAEAPTLSHEPIRPKALITLLLGLATGVCGGLCLALAVEYFDRSLKTSEEIECRLGLPVLASIPESNGRHLIARS